jgi:nicotinamide-nucleotide amidase
MSAAVLSIGTEITRGEIVNTNAAWLAAKLTELGFDVTAAEVVDDDETRIVAALRRLGASHDVIVCTGGLGPTTDDLTTVAVAATLGVPTFRHEPSLDSIRRRFEKMGRALSPTNEKQADFPDGAEILPNAAGTAPAFAVTIDKALSFFLPGVPREVMRLWDDHLIGRLRPLAPNTTHQIRIRTFGMPESLVGERLAGLEAQHPGLVLGYRATFPEIEVKVLVRESSREQAQRRAITIADEVRLRLGPVVYGEGDDTFPEVVGRALLAKGFRLAVAESCTGGLVGHLVTSAPASEWFLGGAIVYANTAKTRLLGVNEDTLRAHGAVSAEVAAAMAEGARRACGADVALAITGIAGPTGGTPEKPVGLVHWAVAHPGGLLLRDRVLFGDRKMIQRAAAFGGLALVREVCLAEDRASGRIRLGT